MPILYIPLGMFHPRSSEILVMELRKTRTQSPELCDVCSPYKKPILGVWNLAIMSWSSGAHFFALEA